MFISDDVMYFELIVFKEESLCLQGVTSPTISSWGARSLTPPIQRVTCLGKTQILTSWGPDLWRQVDSHNNSGIKCQKRLFKALLIASHGLPRRMEFVKEFLVFRVPFKMLKVVSEVKDYRVGPKIKQNSFKIIKISIKRRNQYQLHEVFLVSRKLLSN